MLSLQSFPRKGVSLGYVGLNYHLKDLRVQGLVFRVQGLLLRVQGLLRRVQG